MSQYKIGLVSIVTGASLVILLPLALVAMVPATSTSRPNGWAIATAEPVVARMRLTGAERAAVVVEAAGERHGASAKPRRALSILQIGDSHTAADFFTGTVRHLLQQRHAVGGLGYLHVGTPHPGLRSSQVRISASASWTYESIQRSVTPEIFGLSGYNASTNAEGSTLTMSNNDPIPYDTVEIDARTGPQNGSIVVLIDDKEAFSASLAADRPGAKVFMVRPPSGKPATFRKLVIRANSASPVTLAAVTVKRPDTGVTYSAVGYPGGTIETLGKIPTQAIRDAFEQLTPDIVVLAFGTNEGFNDKLDPAAYREQYRAVLRKVRQSAPRAKIVIVGPPQAERVAPACKPSAGTCSAVVPAIAGNGVDGPPGPDACPSRPPQLGAVREAQRQLAREEGIPFWDWWAIMPSGCGAESWASAAPPLMARDHVHFTRAGYKASGHAFASFIEPQIVALLRGDNAVSNN